MRRLDVVLTTLLMSVVFLSLQPLVYASLPGFGEGVTLFYRGARMSTSGQGSIDSWDTLTKILNFNETTLVFQSDSASPTSTMNSTVTVMYQDGAPIYVDYLTALIYLPPDCIIQSLQGNLEWTKQIATRTLTNVTVETAQALNFTVPAGTFQSVNITMALTEPEYGAIAFIYDVASGILIYEQWVPNYGDIIVLSLKAATYGRAMQQTIFSLILPAITLIIPAAIVILQTQRLLKRRSHAREKRLERASLKSGFPKRPFCVILLGASLNLASVFLPWSQFSRQQIFLPLSLPSAFAEPIGPFMSEPSFATVSLIAHATAILAWISIAMHLYTTKGIVAQLLTIASSILAIASSVIFIQTGWTSSWGLPATVIGAILAIAATAAANMKIEITSEEQEESEDTSNYKPLLLRSLARQARNQP